jgi:hypothetical protein
MMKSFLKLMAQASLFNFLFLCIALGSESLTTSDFKEVHSKVLQLSKQYGNSQVLVALDIDNTLLAMNQDLGSEPWFDWQASLLSQESPDKMAKDFKELLSLNQMIVNLSGTHLTQKEIPEYVADLQRQGITVIIVTSRGFEDRLATMREFKKNQLDFSSNAIGPIASPYFLPYDLANLGAVKVTPEEATTFKLGEPKPVWFENGVYLTEGQHKGVMMRALLAKSNRSFQSIVFVDNTEKQCKRVQDAFAAQQKEGKPVDVVTFRFGRQDDDIERFKKSDKREVIEAWKNLRRSLDVIFK